MSEKNISDGRIVIASVGTIIWRERNGEIEILTGIRQNEPWAGCSMAVFGGLVDANDFDIKAAAIREAKEETGIIVRRRELIDVGIYGPKALHHAIKLIGYGRKFKATPTREEISEKYKFVMVVFAAKYKSGRTKNNKEVKSLKFDGLIKLAEKKTELAFDQGKILEDFYKITAVFDRDPNLQR